VANAPSSLRRASGNPPRADAVIPLLHAPDDPGPEPEADSSGRTGDQRPLSATLR